MMMTKTISVLLADDHALVRETLSARLGTEGDIQVLGTFPTAHECLVAAAQHQPDVVLFDIDMPGQSCFEAATQLRSRCPETAVVFLSAFFHDRYIQQAIAAEAMGYVTKSEPPEQVVAAIRAVAAGELFYSPEIMARLVIEPTGVRLAAGTQARWSQLTPREMEVLRQVARGLSKKEIAAVLHISVKTVENHTQSIMTKLDIHDRVHLARYAIREGLTEA